MEQINLDGKTALHDAAQFCQPGVLKYLLLKGRTKSESKNIIDCNLELETVLVMIVFMCIIVNQVPM